MRPAKPAGHFAECHCGGCNAHRGYTHQLLQLLFIPLMPLMLVAWVAMFAIPAAAFLVTLYAVFYALSWLLGG